MKRPAFRSIPVAVGGETYHVIARTIPARNAPHAGADSPRYMEPGRRATVEVLRILRGGDDVTDRLMPWTREKIDAALQETGRKGG